MGRDLPPSDRDLPLSRLGWDLTQRPSGRDLPLRPLGRDLPLRPSGQDLPPATVPASSKLGVRRSSQGRFAPAKNVCFRRKHDFGVGNKIDI